MSDTPQLESTIDSMLYIAGIHHLFSYTPSITTLDNFIQFFLIECIRQSTAEFSIPPLGPTNWKNVRTSDPTCHQEMTEIGRTVVGALVWDVVVNAYPDLPIAFVS